MRRLSSYNVTFANYVNYQTGLQLSWTDYAAAANADSCNLGNYTGNSSQTQTVICASALPLTDTTGILEIDSPCARAATMATAIGQSLYQQRQKLALSYFDSAYGSRCLSAASLEQFTVKDTTSEYHYTLYYYDLAGNLVKTVPPKGARPNFSAAFIKSVDSSRAIGAVDTPQHVFSTRYCYNSLNSVIAQRTPDAGVSQFWYDRLGRLVVSQNAQQNHDGNYSYTVYDALSRITEVGQTPQSTAMTPTVSQDSAGFAAWMNATTSSRTQITATVYDVAAWTMAPLMTQNNLRNRVSYTYTKNNATDGNFYTASYYTYDVHGNVDTLIQDYLYVPGMSTTPYKRICYDYDLVSGKVNGVDYQPGSSDAFYYRYQYDAENRLTNVLTSRDSITWEQDAFYLYYKHGPLSRTVLGQLQTQGIDYTYTLQGWLKGVNIGNGYAAAVVDSSGSFCAAGSALSDVVVTSRSVTDTPYTYTARSSVTFDSGFETYDGDSLQTNIDDSLTACNLPASGGDTASASGLSENYPVAQDAYSFSLHYYPGDYNAIGATTPVTDVLTTLGSQASPLYNGNIAASAVVLPGGLRPQVYSYQYDQLNRLVQMKVDTGLNAATHTFTPVQLPDYGERVAYDPNGNINGYVRHGYGANIPMDSLTYHYYANTNQLQRINDSAGGSYTTDLKDQGTGSNYTYDLNGQLKQDATNGVSAIDWTVYGKIDTVVNGSGTIAYTYDAAGNRITKSFGGANSIYVRDAQGNILAIYTQSGSGAPTQTEVDLYGSSRLGSVSSLTAAPTSVSLSGGYGTAYLSTFSRGEKSYELTNHLGNVLSTITDKKIAVSSTTDSSLIDHFTADVATAQDYYPFGMVMPGRAFTASSASNYRYGFNGQEQDPEVEGTGNFYDYGMRGYDPRVGRFPSVDPLTKKYPWYTPYSFAGNKPIVAADLDGMEEWMKTQENLLRQNAILRIDATRVKEQSKIPHLSQTPYEDQVQQYQHEQNSTRLWNAAGYNDDGSKPFLKRLSDNKTWNNFAENLALPLLEGASYADGAGELKALFKGGVQSFYRAMSKEEFAAFSTTGKLPVGGEKFVSTELAYSKSYIGKPGYEVLVQFNTKEGTLQKLAQIGVRDNSNLVKQKGFGSLPEVFKGWSPTNALFKGEGSTLNIGLGNGKALEEFNKNLLDYKVVTP